MTPTHTAVTCANPTSHTNSPSSTGPALAHTFPLAPRPVACFQVWHGVSGMFSRSTGENGTKTIPAQYVQAGLGHWEAELLHGLSQTHLPSPRLCRLLSGLWAGQSPRGRGYKKRMQEACDRAAATNPPKSLLEMQKREETGFSQFHRKGSLRGPLLPSRMSPSTRRLRQRRYSRCILLLSLAEDELEAMELQERQER